MTFLRTTITAVFLIKSQKYDIFVKTLIMVTVLTKTKRQDILRELRLWSQS